MNRNGFVDLAEALEIKGNTDRKITLAKYGIEAIRLKNKGEMVFKLAHPSVLSKSLIGL